VTLSLHPLAEHDLAEIVDYYARLDPDLPVQLVAELDESLDSILHFPLMRPVVFGEFRQVVLDVFPYRVVYRFSGQVVRVLTVVHTRRDPAWLEQTVQDRT
jgi:plasmid stabilization system protein ParE